MSLEHLNAEEMRVATESLISRVRRPSHPRIDQANDEEKWIGKWRDAVADGDANAFKNRLDMFGVSKEDAIRRLNAPSEAPPQSIPNWVETLDELIDSLSGSHPEPSPNVNTADAIPFEDVLRPIVVWWSRRIPWNRYEDVIVGQGREDLEEWLVRRLSTLSAHTLFIEFKSFLAAHDEELAFADDPSLPEDPKQYYGEFIEMLFDDGLVNFVHEYPMLARYLVHYLEQWRTYLTEFLDHLREDYDEVTSAFADGDSVGRVVGINTRGDQHQGGRVVLKVTFETGLTVGYKPRDTRPESAFSDLLSWINARSSLPDLFAPACLVQDGYGWVEWIDGSPCQTSADVRRFYIRAGALLCTLYALNFVDGHLENLIAMGDHPVVVDLETLMSPNLPSSALPPSNKISEGRQKSVLRTGLLPEDSEEMVAKRMSGLDAPAGYLSGETRTFENPNTDIMELRYEASGERPGESLPLLNGSRIRPHEYVEQIASGFDATYRFLASASDELLDADGPIESFSGADIRFVFRPTATYRTVLVPLTTPECHRDARALHIRFERLTRPFVMDRAADSLWPLHLAERTALDRGDIPRFTVPTDETTVYHDGEPVADIFPQSPLQQVQDRIKSFAPEDRYRQLDLIRTAYGGSEIELFNQRCNQQPWISKASNAAPSDSSPTDVAQSVGTQVLSRLESTREHTLDGSRAWYRRRATETGVRVSTLDDGVYNGTLGLATFAAGLAAVTGDELPERFARETAAEVSEAENAAELSTVSSIGLDDGWGSRTYGFTLIGDILTSDAHLQRARANARHLVHLRERNDHGNDLISGRAGGILSLLALANRTGEDEWIGHAVRYGDDLLDDQISVNGYRIWERDRDSLSENSAVIGTAHGISGIALALARLYDATGLSRFKIAASEAVEYERSTFNPQRGNWRNSSPDLNAWLDSWCSGRAGIGMVRVELARLLGTDDYLERLKPVLDNTTVELSEKDHLCCGNCSRVAFLQRVGRELERPELVTRATNLALETVDRAYKRGRFRVPNQTDWWYNPSLFHGEPGIAYSLLKLVDPELPRVTVVE